MQMTTLLFLLALFAGVVWFVTRPFGQGGKTPQLTDDHEVSSLLAERDRLLQTLEELDFDHALGKVPTEEYSLQRSALLKRGAALLKRLDTLTQRTQPPPANNESVESALSAQRSPAPSTITDDEIETLIAARRAARKARSGGFCPACGTPVLASDRFCPSCGKTIQ